MLHFAFIFYSKFLHHTDAVNDTVTTYRRQMRLFELKEITKAVIHGNSQEQV
ncbi:hypothetical protein HMPREF0766_14328 [Sphingobacterium spiritivorum ATCC 33861]|uniref:Uncharacterized protein n=1 Tax=Sphingobacterium spiritivorum ATCC 33861 TaxID=525373 RepID=D7VPW8_SPHSI|nr:hypothetical protein HMPREF0766_14328 [Sphingobacterium spiritivorum ATCC 33861]